MEWTSVPVASVFFRSGNCGFFFCAFKIVGVCTEELQAAQQWNGQGILDLLRGVRV